MLFDFKFSEFAILKKINNFGLGTVRSQAMSPTCTVFVSTFKRSIHLGELRVTIRFTPGKISCSLIINCPLRSHLYSTLPETSFEACKPTCISSDTSHYHRGLRVAMGEIVFQTGTDHAMLFRKLFLRLDFLQRNSKSDSI